MTSQLFPLLSKTSAVSLKQKTLPVTSQFYFVSLIRLFKNVRRCWDFYYGIEINRIRDRQQYLQDGIIMIEKPTQSYIHNDLFHLPSHQIANDLVIYIEDPSSDYFKTQMRVYAWAQIFQFKQQILKLQIFSKLSMSSLRLFHKNIQLSNDKKTLLDYNIGSGSVILVQRRNKIQQGSKGVINPYKLFDKANEKVAYLIKQSVEAINSGNIPTLTNEGTSGVYMIENQNKDKISIFKPFDEQVNAPNNPRGKQSELGSDGICKGILSGECATREVAAYLLDNQKNNFHDVPTTTYIEFYHPTFTHMKQINETPIHSSQQLTINIKNKLTKHGSLQQFVESDGLICDYGTKRFTDHQIHKIGILDIRILNCDRNEENVLIKEQEGNKLKLIPIDHGLSFPDNLQIYEQSMLWMNFPQSKIPFSADQLKFIQQINPVKDAEILESKLGFRQICLRNFRIAEIFLKKAANMGFTLYEIGKMLYRVSDYEEDSDGSKGKGKRSNIETIVMQAQSLYLNALQTMQKENMQELDNISEISDDLLQIFQDNDDESQDKKSTSNSSSTCGSIKSLLQLRKKVSLPQLQRKDTSFHQSRNKARKQRQGVNGISKTIWNKYHQDEWNELFYYYFENLLDTLLLEKSTTKTRKLNHRTQSAK